MHMISWIDMPDDVYFVATEATRYICITNILGYLSHQNVLAYTLPYKTQVDWCLNHSLTRHHLY